ncbi:MAG: alpha/beta hydrolase [Chitinophagaceae bacterium]|nr:alpha/beta hydrolase [Chitinophagaceae bacterium]
MFILIIPDLPGSGRSSVISRQSAVGIEEYVIKEILNFEVSKVSPSGGDSEGAVMAGHSMGGYITLAFAEKYPDLLSSIALVHSSAFADSEEKKANRLKSIEFVKKNGAYEFLKAAIVDLFTEKWASENAAIVEAQVEKGKAFTDEAIVQYYRAMIARPDRTHVLKNFPKPILFIIGEHDKAVPFEQSMQQCYLPVQSHIHILRNSAHMGMLEEAGKVNNALLQLK